MRDKRIDTMYRRHQSIFKARNNALAATLKSERSGLSRTSASDLFGRLIIDRLSSREVLAISLLVLVLISLILLIR